MYLDKARREFEGFSSIGYTEPIPCTNEEVEELETWIKHRLPEAYREFLLWMGHSGGGFLRGSDCFYRYLKDIQVWAEELLREDHFPDTLPDNVFIFFMHQGYQFKFFHLNDGNDPPIYSYVEKIPTRTSFIKIYPKFSDFLLAEIVGSIKLENEIIQKRHTHSSSIRRTDLSRHEKGRSDSKSES